MRAAILRGGCPLRGRLRTVLAPAAPPTAHAHPAVPGVPQSGWSNDQCFTNTIWALSNWEHRPTDAWLDDFCRFRGEAPACAGPA
jgi:hypothetical protein